MISPLLLKNISVPALQTFLKLLNSGLIQTACLVSGISLEADSVFGVLLVFYLWPFISDLKQSKDFYKEATQLINCF